MKIQMISEDRKSHIIEQYISSYRGRKRLAQVMIAPLLLKRFNFEQGVLFAELESMDPNFWKALPIMSLAECPRVLEPYYLELVERGLKEAV